MTGVIEFIFAASASLAKVKAMLVEEKIQARNYFPLSADKLFGGLPPASLEFLNRIKREKRFEKDAVIYSAGEQPAVFYILLEGRIVLRFDDGRGGRRIAPTEIFGLTETIAAAPFETNAETLTPCLCEYIKRADLVDFLLNEPETSFRFLRRLADNLQKNYQLLCSLKN